MPFTPGVPVPLNTNGLEVTLTLDTPFSVFHRGDFWMFAARPATPQKVYPERFLATPQPPNGPRLWACPLGVITWGSASGGVGSGASVEDCRRIFSPLNRLVFAEANGGPAVGPRDTLNFIGAGITVADNKAAKRIDINIPGGGGSTETSPSVLLFPFATNTLGFDTGIFVCNTTADPFGTVPQSGTVTFSFFGTGGPGTPVVLGPITGGQNVEFVVSAKAPGFQGYIIAVCQFAGGYGFAFVTDATQKNSGAYVALTLPKRPIGS